MIPGGTPVAKALGWDAPDGEGRNPGERTGLDTRVVLGVNDAGWVLERLSVAPVPKGNR